MELLTLSSFRGRGRHGTVSALDYGLSSPGLRPGQGHCVVFLGRHFTLEHNASLHPGV